MHLRGAVRWHMRFGAHLIVARHDHHGPTAGAFALSPASPLRAIVPRDVATPRRPQQVHDGHAPRRRCTSWRGTGRRPTVLRRVRERLPSFEQPRDDLRADGTAADLNLSCAVTPAGKASRSHHRRMTGQGGQEHARASRVGMVHHHAVATMHAEVHAIEQPGRRHTRRRRAGVPFSGGTYQREQGKFGSFVGQSHGPR